MIGDVAALCARHGLELREVFASHYGLVARVRDGGGRNLLLKAHQRDQHDCLDEAEALRAWEACDGVPELVDVYPDGHHLREFIVGTPLSDLPDAGRAQARAAGWLLRELHQPAFRPVADAAPRTWLSVEAAKLAMSRHLDSRERERVARLAAILVETPGATLVHGDFYHRNILLSERGLVAIDPLARHDLPASDIATFTMTCPGADVDSVLEDLLDGYASEPPAVAEYMDLWGLRNRHYRGAFDAAADASATWQGCFVAEGDGLVWVD